MGEISETGETVIISDDEDHGHEDQAEYMAEPRLLYKHQAEIRYPALG